MLQVTAMPYDTAISKTDTLFFGEVSNSTVRVFETRECSTLSQEYTQFRKQT